jgi:hypothetical protein
MSTATRTILAATIVFVVTAAARVPAVFTSN